MSLSESQYLCTQGFDTETSLLAYYKNLQRFCGATGVQGLRLGTAGDVEQVNPESLLPVEAIVAGPPCQPWAGTGHQLGTTDARASVMDACIGWIISQAAPSLRSGGVHPHVCCDRGSALPVSALPAAPGTFVDPGLEERLPPRPAWPAAAFHSQRPRWQGASGNRVGLQSTPNRPTVTL